MSGRLTSEQLKKLAMGTMFLDHLAVAVIYGHGLNRTYPFLDDIGLAMRLVGRMAFPLYAFLLVQGFLWTRDWKKYLSRMAIFALISEIPFNLVLAGEIGYPYAQNTIVTLTVGLLCLKMIETLERKYELSMGGAGPSGIIGYALVIWVIAASMAAVELLCGDYGAFGLILIVLFYIFRYRPTEQMVACCVGLVMIYGFGIEVLFAWIAIFLISRYNGERGRKLGLMPYVFYPVHLLAVWLAGAAIV